MGGEALLHRSRDQVSLPPSTPRALSHPQLLSLPTHSFAFCELPSSAFSYTLPTTPPPRFGLQGAISPSVLDDDVSAADPITNPQIVCLNSSFLPAQHWPSSSFQSKYMVSHSTVHISSACSSHPCSLEGFLASCFKAPPVI